jgi:FkbM family methyltransferase
MDFSIYELFDDIPFIEVVDIGASPIDGEPPYNCLLPLNRGRVIGFEPNPEQYRLLEKKQSKRRRFLPYAVGDGAEHTLHICASPGMCSLLEPDMEILNSIQGFGEWGTVIGKERVATRRLDDIEEINQIDYLKMDVQGSELTILKNAQKYLKQILVIQLEVNFIPFYKEQPLFAELDQVLRSAGFYLHRFTPLISRAFKPLIVNNDVYAGLSQLLWTDAIFVRKFTEFSQLTTSQLLKIAAIAHEMYQSYDLSLLALQSIDRQDRSERHVKYLNRLTGKG